MIDWIELQHLYQRFARTVPDLEKTELWCRSIGIDPAATLRITDRMILDVATAVGDSEKLLPALAHGTLMFGIFVGMEAAKSGKGLIVP